MAKTIDKAIDELLKDYENIIVKAAEYATDEVCKEVYQYAMSCLEAYYDNYDPSSYDRTDYLWHAILPYAEKPRIVGNNVVSTVGVEYDSSKLDKIYSSNASEQYQPVDGHWVLYNYLHGIHPTTNGGRSPETAVYIQVIDDEAPWDKMRRYLKNDVPEKFKSNLYVYFLKNLKA